MATLCLWDMMETSPIPERRCGVGGRVLSASSPDTVVGGGVGGLLTLREGL